MPFVRRIKEAVSTLRFRIVFLIILFVSVVVVVQNITLREVQDRILRHSYDEFLQESLSEVHALIEKFDPSEREQLFEALKDKRKTYEHRSWFLEVYDEDGRVIWASANAPVIGPPKLNSDSKGPYDARSNRGHRVYEKKMQRESGEIFYVRCGFLQTALQDDIALLNRFVLIASISVIILAPIGAYVVALRATQPITQIIQTASQLRPGHLQERLPIRGTGDELDLLSVTINGMLDRLASYIDQNRDFVANAAHELRSPLAAIRASVEVGLNQTRTPEEYANILSDVMEEITRLAGLVNRLLILAEGDVGRIGGRDQTTRLDKIVRESVEMFDAVAELKGVRLVIAEVAHANVPGEETYLRQVIRNLIDNAIKYNRNPGEVIIRLRVDPAKKQVYLSIKDTGPGIDPAVLPRIFERFYRADKSRVRDKERAGYGLGLSICQVIVQSLKGDITVESELGRGSTFSVRLPLVEDSATLAGSVDRPLPATLAN